MQFPETVEEFMEKYKIIDTERIYTNGIELVPIFRMQQWFEHLNTKTESAVYSEFINEDQEVEK